MDVWHTHASQHVGPPQSSGRWVARLSPATPSRALERPLTRVLPGGSIEFGVSVGWVSVQCSRDVPSSCHAHVYLMPRSAIRPSWYPRAYARLRAMRHTTQVETRWPERTYFLLSREEQQASGVSL